MRVTLWMTLLLIAAAGCGSNSPDAAAVKELMTSHQRALSDPIVNSVGMLLVPIPAGEFQMGTAVDNESLDETYEKLLQNPEVKAKLESEGATKTDVIEHLRWERQKSMSEVPQHSVKITKPFMMSSCEVTQEQYEKVMGTRPWLGKPLVKEKANYAASYVKWEDAAEFCRKLTELENNKYRLPTEAEWEYACRAGTTTTWHFGDDGQQLGDYGWHGANAYQDGEQYPHAIGQKLPNAWGLYDMHGNVWEWCQDWYAAYGRKPRVSINPAGPSKGNYRVWRGGSFFDPPDSTRSATRLSQNREDYRPEYLAGFRVVREFTTAE